MAIRMVQQHCL